MVRQKYGKNKRTAPVFDIVTSLEQTSPPPAVDNLAAQLEQLSITIPRLSSNEPLKERSLNIPTKKDSRAGRKKKNCVNPPLDPLTNLLQLCQDPCHRSQPQAFREWSESLEPFFDVTKIAEASYGQVYLLDIKSSHQSNNAPDGSVIKILALKTPESKQQCSWASNIDSVVSEVKLLQRMTDIPGFTIFRDIRVLKGRPSPVFAKAWKKWNSSRPKHDRSLFPDPSKKVSYEEDQLWAVIEMQNAGTDLEHAGLDTVWTCWDIFWGVTLALAKGEQEAKFEHRDLHDGNICVKTRRDDGNIPAKISPIRDFSRTMGFSGLETTIIDYTISRAETVLTPASRLLEEKCHVDFVDLETFDEEIFEGDSSQNYQYEIYRYMRSALFFSDPLVDYNKMHKNTSPPDRSWAGFHPQTNLIWLHFLNYYLIQNMIWPKTDMEKTLQHVEIEDLKERRAARKRAIELEMALKQLRKHLNIKSIPRTGLSSACDLVVLALEKGWLCEQDVIGEGDSSLLSVVSTA